MDIARAPGAGGQLRFDATRGEKQGWGEKENQHGHPHYRAEDLPLVAMMAVGAGYVSVLVMALYVNSPEVTDLYARPEVLFGICAILLFWISRIVLITHRGKMHDDPVVFAAKDKVSYAAFGLVFLLVVAGAQL